ncbi:hypothetical protein GCM10009624_21390 [Gordonia sinesedis]
MAVGGEPGHIDLPDDDQRSAHLVVGGHVDTEAARDSEQSDEVLGAGDRPITKHAKRFRLAHGEAG